MHPDDVDDCTVVGRVEDVNFDCDDGPARRGARGGRDEAKFRRGGLVRLTRFATVVVTLTSVEGSLTRVDGGGGAPTGAK